MYEFIKRLLMTIVYTIIWFRFPLNPTV